MTAAAARVPAPHDEWLLHLMRAIALGVNSTSPYGFQASPALATASMTAGATRQGAPTYFLEGIRRYVYAGDTALHVAAAAYRSDIVSMLLTLGADVNAKNRRGATPLHDAATGAPGSERWNPVTQTETVTQLLAAGADIRAPDATGMTPLHRAVRTRCSAAVSALLNHGADARRTNHNGSTPMHLAEHGTGRGGTGTPEARHEQAEIIRLLIAHGADPSRS